MGRATGIYRDDRTGRYWVDKRYRGVRLRDNFESYQAAEEWLIHQLDSLRRQKQFGERPRVKFAAAAARFLEEKRLAGKPSAKTDVYHLDAVMPFLGHLDIDKIHDGTLKAFRAARRAEGRKTKTINLSISAVRAVLNKAAELWRDDATGLTLLERAPTLVEKRLDDQRPPRPVTWEEQIRLLQVLPVHLAEMALFMLNTGARDDVVVSLKWEWEVPIPELGVSVFLVPEEHVKGRRTEKVLALNSVAQSVVERMRGRHPENVFVWRRERTSTTKKHKAPPMAYRPVETMNNTAWQTARTKAGLGDLHVHDLRHTVGGRLREGGVAERGIADILWHAGGSITSHYSVASIGELVRALELIKDPTGQVNKSILTLRAEARAKRIERVSSHRNSEHTS